MKTMTLPVRVEPGLRGNVFVLIADNKAFIAEIYSEGRGPVANLMVADEIAKCINMHDEMRDLLEHFMRQAAGGKLDLTIAEINHLELILTKAETNKQQGG